MTPGDFVIVPARRAPSGRVGEFEAYCPDCDAAYQQVEDGWRCPWATAKRQRVEHDDGPGFRIIACGRT